MLTHSLTRLYKDTSGVAIQGVETASADTELNFDGAVPIGANYEIDWTCTKANLKTLCLTADKAVTIKTNDSGSPQETITLTAGQLLLWSLAQDGGGSCPFSADITKLYVTAAAIANFKIRALADQTPV